MTDQLNQGLVGSTDWAGFRAPAGGSRTGTATLTMKDGKTFAVAHSRAEVLRKMDSHAVAPTTPRWVAFDVPGTAVPIVLDVVQVAKVI